MIASCKGHQFVRLTDSRPQKRQKMQRAIRPQKYTSRLRTATPGASFKLLPGRTSAYCQDCQQWKHDDRELQGHLPLRVDREKHQISGQHDDVLESGRIGARRHST